jgi:hypothetical protein
LLQLACPQIGTAAGTWSVVSLPQQPGEVIIPTAVAADLTGPCSAVSHRCRGESLWCASQNSSRRSGVQVRYRQAETLSEPERLNT